MLDRRAWPYHQDRGACRRPCWRGGTELCVSLGEREKSSPRRQQSHGSSCGDSSAPKMAPFNARAAPMSTRASIVKATNVEAAEMLREMEYVGPGGSMAKSACWRGALAGSVGGERWRGAFWREARARLGASIRGTAARASRARAIAASPQGAVDAGGETPGGARGWSACMYVRDVARAAQRAAAHRAP